MHLIDGKALAASIRANTKNDIDRLGLVPKLAILLVGDDPASRLYVNLKKKAAAEVGVAIDCREERADATDDALVRVIESWNRDPSVHGILVQLPLPPGHNEDRVIAAMDPNKDADGFHPRRDGLPPVHEGILRLIGATPISVNGSTAVIIANSDVFSKPLSRLLTKAGASVDLLRADDLDGDRLKAADIVVTAVGRPHFLRANMVKKDAVLIDVGTTRVDGKVQGDIDVQSFEKTEAWISPVPGGVGPMTIAELLKRVTELAMRFSSLCATPRGE